MNRNTQHQQTEKAKSSRLRSCMALLLFAVYALGNFVFSQSALCVFGQIEGQHEVLVRGNQVILHHPNQTQAPHRPWAQLLVAVSHTNPAGDHELPCAPQVIADPEPVSANTSSAQVLHAHDDDQAAFEHHALDRAIAKDCGMVRHGTKQITGDPVILQWRTVKRMV
jgi:hypothetical protein